MTAIPGLPVDEVLPLVLTKLEDHDILIVAAPPGTGKTTRIPPALRSAPWLDDRKVLMLEPRRIAARTAAARIAGELGENVGETVGLRTRFDTRVGGRTRLEVLTEGVLTRMLISDPALREAGVVVFDEFHERNLHADVALTFLRETREALRPDLKIVIMSATIDTTALTRKLDTDAVVTVEVPAHPIDTFYRAPAPGRRVEDEVPDAVLHALTSWAGDILVFMAGARDIQRAVDGLARRIPPDVAIQPLHGSMSRQAQDAALQPDPHGRRRVVIATPIAESSVTVPGVRIVIDTGLRRRPEHDVGRGLSRLRTVVAGTAAADQRRGRSGREGPGVCIRLWPESDQAHRPADDPPEITTADLTGTALDIAAWGATDANELPWLDPPPASSLAAAHGVLTRLDAIDDDRRLTAHGRDMVELGAEPRLAHLMLRGAELGLAATACDLAAILADRDMMRGRSRPVDIRLGSTLWDDGTDVDLAGRAGPPSGNRWRRRFDAGDDSADAGVAGLLISLAFPERIAQRRKEPGGFLLCSGVGLSIDTRDALAHEDYLAVAVTDGAGGDATVVMAAPIDLDVVLSHHGHRIDTSAGVGGTDELAMSSSSVRSGSTHSFFGEREDSPDPEAVAEALLAGIRREGLEILGWTAADRRWRDRAQFVHRQGRDDWPAFDDSSLLADLEDWVAPSLGSARGRADLSEFDVLAGLTSRLDWREVRELDRLAPTHLDVPSGSRIPIDYSAEGGPVVAVRLQEMFGQTVTPTVFSGEVPLTIHLLSPAHRPVQVTRDLVSFWANGYADVRRELRGRYPRHEWPEDPLSAPPTRRAKRRR
ncbi:MAG: ATP-dependent helicase HrpB [Acidimicrobiales bacterium]